MIQIFFIETTTSNINHNFTRADLTIANYQDILLLVKNLYNWITFLRILNYLKMMSI